MTDQERRVRYFEGKVARYQRITETLGAQNSTAQNVAAYHRAYDREIRAMRELADERGKLIRECLSHRAA